MQRDVTNMRVSLVLRGILTRYKEVPNTFGRSVVTALVALVVLLLLLLWVISELFYAVFLSMTALIMVSLTGAGQVLRRLKRLAGFARIETSTGTRRKNWPSTEK